MTTAAISAVSYVDASIARIGTSQTPNPRLSSSNRSSDLRAGSRRRACAAGRGRSAANHADLTSDASDLPAKERAGSVAQFMGNCKISTRRHAETALGQRDSGRFGSERSSSSTSRCPASSSLLHDAVPFLRGGMDTDKQRHHSEATSPATGTHGDNICRHYRCARLAVSNYMRRRFVR